MRKLIPVILTLAACFTAAAQTSSGSRYTTLDSVTLSAAGEKLTIQQPASGAMQVKFESGIVYCSVACTVTLSQNGTAATATGAVEVPILPTAIPAAAQAFTASNAGAGTVLQTYQLSAGATLPIDLSKISMGNTGTGTNLSLAVSSITGTASLSFIWSEQ